MATEVPVKVSHSGHGTYSVKVLIKGGKTIVIDKGESREHALADAIDILRNGLVIGGEKLDVRGVKFVQRGAKGAQALETEVTPPAPAETPHAHDFDTVEAAVQHAKGEGATHTRVIGRGRGSETIVYWPDPYPKQFYERAIYKSRGKFHLPKDATLVDIEARHMRALEELTQGAAEAAPVLHEAGRRKSSGKRGGSTQNTSIIYGKTVDGRTEYWYGGGVPGAWGPDKKQAAIVPESDAPEIVRTMRANAAWLKRINFEGNVEEHEAAEAAPVVEDAKKACVPWVRVTRDPERYQSCLATAQKVGPIDNARKIYDLLSASLAKEDQEVFLVVLTDVRRQLRGVAEVARGQRSRVSVGLNDVMRVVLVSGAESFTLVHNHPSGKATASDADRELTRSIAAAAKPYGREVTFLDHVVIGMHEFYSIRENKLYRVR